MCRRSFSCASFLTVPLLWSNWKLEMLVFVKGRKQECPEKNQIITLVLVPSLQVANDDKIAVYPST